MANLASTLTSSSIPAASLIHCAQQALDELAVRFPGANGGHNAQTLFNMRADHLIEVRANHPPVTAAHSAQSASGACHLLKTADAWIALNQARVEDESLLAAWLEQTRPLCWAELPSLVLAQTSADLVTRGRVLGLPIAPLGPERAVAHWYKFHRAMASEPMPQQTAALAPPLVVDLSSLWAGPLCTHLLQHSGMRVVKVESTQRPDPTRHSMPDFFSALHQDKEFVSFDFNASTGRAALWDLIQQADIVIEGSRPRALQQLGIHVERFLNDPAKLWLSLTAYGRDDPYANWVGFGDDVAVAAGAYQAPTQTRPPAFCGDAIADPLTGIYAALAVLDTHAQGLGGLIDLSLYSVTNFCVQRTAQC